MDRIVRVGVNGGEVLVPKVQLSNPGAISLALNQVAVNGLIKVQVQGRNIQLLSPADKPAAGLEERVEAVSAKDAIQKLLKRINGGQMDFVSGFNHAGLSVWPSMTAMDPQFQAIVRMVEGVARSSNAGLVRLEPRGREVYLSPYSIVPSSQGLSAGLEEISLEQVEKKIRELSAGEPQARVAAAAFIVRTTSGSTLPPAFVQKAEPLVEALVLNLRYRLQPTPTPWHLMAYRWITGSLPSQEDRKVLYAHLVRPQSQTALAALAKHQPFRGLLKAKGLLSSFTAAGLEEKTVLFRDLGIAIARYVEFAMDGYGGAMEVIVQLIGPDGELKVTFKGHSARWDWPDQIFSELWKIGVGEWRAKEWLMTIGNYDEHNRTKRVFQVRLERSPSSPSAAGAEETVSISLDSSAAQKFQALVGAISKNTGTDLLDRAGVGRLVSEWYKTKGKWLAGKELQITQVDPKRYLDDSGDLTPAIGILFKTGTWDEEQALALFGGNLFDQTRDDWIVRDTSIGTTSTAIEMENRNAPSSEERIEPQPVVVKIKNLKQIVGNQDLPDEVRLWAAILHEIEPSSGQMVRSLKLFLETKTVEKLGEQVLPILAVAATLAAPGVIESAVSAAGAEEANILVVKGKGLLSHPWEQWVDQLAKQPGVRAVVMPVESLASPASRSLIHKMYPGLRAVVLEVQVPDATTLQVVRDINAQFNPSGQERKVRIAVVHSAPLKPLREDRWDVPVPLVDLRKNGQLDRTIHSTLLAGQEGLEVFLENLMQPAAGAEEGGGLRRLLIVGEKQESIDALKDVVRSARPGLEVKTAKLPDQLLEILTTLDDPAQAPDAAMVAGGFFAILSNKVSQVVKQLEIAGKTSCFLSEPYEEEVIRKALNSLDENVRRSTGLEEAAVMTQQRVQRPLRLILEEAPNGIVPTIVGKELLQKMSALRVVLAGHQDQNVFLDDGNLPALLADLMGKDIRDVVFVGLKEEAQGFEAAAKTAGFTPRLIVADPERPGEFFDLILKILSQATGVREATFKARVEFQELMVGLEEMDSGA